MSPDIFIVRGEYATKVGKFLTRRRVSYGESGVHDQYWAFVFEVLLVLPKVDVLVNDVGLGLEITVRTQ